MPKKELHDLLMSLMTEIHFNDLIDDGDNHPPDLIAPDEYDGCCNGFAETVIDAWLGNGEKGLLHFIEICDYIKKYHTHIISFYDFARLGVKKLAQSITPLTTSDKDPSIPRAKIPTQTLNLSSDQISSFEAMALLQTIFIYQNPYLFQNLLRGYVGQNAADFISYFVQPATLEADGKTTLTSLSWLYTPAELTKLIPLLETYLSNPSHNFAIRFCSHDHSIALLFSCQTQYWYFVDVNDSYIQGLEKADFTDHILKAFGTTYDYYCPLTWSFCCRTTAKPFFEQQLLTLRRDSSFIALHTPDEANIHRVTKDKITLPWLYALDGADIEHFQVLSSFKTKDGQSVIDFNVPTKDGDTPLMIAISNHHQNIILFLLSLKDKHGKRITNPHHRDDFILLKYALTFHDIEILEFLTNLKKQNKTTLKKKFYIHVNKQNELGETIVHFSVTNSYFNALRFLATLTTVDGKMRVNFNMENHLGETPALLAAKQNNLEALHCLASLKNRDNEYIVDFHTYDGHNQSLVFIAIINENLSLLSFLASLKKPDGNPLIDFSKPDNVGDTPLYTAVFNQKIASIESLLRFGATLSSLHDQETLNVQLANPKIAALLSQAAEEEKATPVKILQQPPLSLLSISLFAEKRVKEKVGHEEPSTKRFKIQ